MLCDKFAYLSCYTQHEQVACTVHVNLLCSAIEASQFSFSFGNSGLAPAAGGRNEFPRQPTGLVGGQEHCDRRDVRGLPDAAEWRHGNHLLLVLTSDSDNASRASALGCRCPGVD